MLRPEKKFVNVQERKGSVMIPPQVSGDTVGDIQSGLSNVMRCRRHCFLNKPSSSYLHLNTRIDVIGSFK
jgi:hypothetical protein